jgi:hypothetical protein
MSHPEEMTTTLSVPEEHLELFKLAALHELGDNAEWIKSQAEEVVRLNHQDTRGTIEYVIEREGGPRPLPDIGGRAGRRPHHGKAGDH